MKRLLIVLVAVFIILTLFSCSTSILGIIVNPSRSDSPNSNGEVETSRDSVDIIKNLTHEHTFTVETIAPDCGNKGYTKHTCIDCGYYYLDNIKDEVGSHEFENGVCKICNKADYPTLINIISTEIIKANVSVSVKYYIRTFGVKQLLGESDGSGVVFYGDTNRGIYYILTNNHVVYSNQMATKANYVEYTIIDHAGNEIKASLIARDPDYDLAVLGFESNIELKVLNLSTKNPEKDDYCISLGQPEGQSNTITFGEVLDYGTVNLTETSSSESNVKFNVVKHSAYINNGSSGGALVDYNFNIIGINYAGSRDSTTGNFISSYAIPIEKVIEFLENNNIIEYK